MMVALDDMGLNYMKISDFELFIMLAQSLRPEATKLLLGDLDLTKFKPYEVKDSEEVKLKKQKICKQTITNSIIESKTHPLVAN